MIPENIFLHFLAHRDNRTYSEEPDGTIILNADPTPLQNKPIGWRDIETSFDTVDKYFSNVKALSIPMQYVLDGAAILRYLLYKGKGFEEEVYSVILKWNSETGIHELEYKGRLDLSKANDDPEVGVTVNAKEGGLQADLDASEDVSYELPLDKTNPDAVKILFDGVTLFDKYNYDFYKVDLIYFPFSTAPSVFINNEGDSVGIIHGDTTLEEITNPSYFTSTGNYPFSSINEIVVTIKGEIMFGFQDGIAHGDGNLELALALRTPSQTIYLIDQGTYQTYGMIGFEKTVTLAANEKMSLVYGTNDLGSIATIEKGSYSISFSSINDLSTAWALPPLATVNQIVKKWNTGYSVQSTFLTAHNNILATSGQALRNLPKPVLKYSFKDWWDDYNGLYCLCLNIIGNVMYIEQRKTRFSSNTTNTIFDLNTVADFKIRPDESKIITTIKTGWPDQTYDERNGKYEFNSTNEFKAPVTIKKAELNLVGKGRGDCFGNEFIRGKLNNKDTTDNKGDNEVFLENTVPKPQITGTFLIEWVGATKVLKLRGQAVNAALFPTGKLFETVNNDVADFNGFLFTVASYTIIGADIEIEVVENAPSVAALFTGSVIFPYLLKRVIYHPVTGLPTPNVNGRGAVFNVEEMTPARKLRAWGSYLRSVLFQLPNEKITFQTALKNKDLSTTLLGVTISEKADIQVSELDAPFFLNYIASFTTRVPLTFSKTLSQLNAAGKVRTVVNGFEIFLLPLGKMSSKPVINEAQQWELELSAENNLDTIYKLSQEGLYISDGMNNTLTISIFNPVHFVYYNKTLNARYKYKDIFDDWVHHRNEQFAAQPSYLQPWEMTDIIKLQFITNGIGDIELKIYDCSANEIDSIISTVISNPAVRTPYSLKQIEVNPNDYDEGRYVFVLKSGGVILAISEWQHFAETHENTYIIDYYNSYNKLNAYWTSYRPMIRVQAMWGTESGDGTSVDYNDESVSEILGFETFTTKKLYVGWPYGIPEYLQIKLNNILRLNKCDIESTHTTCPSGSKWEKNERNGYPLNSYAIELRRSSNSMDLNVTDAGVQGGVGAAYTLDAEAFGRAPGVISVDVTGG